MNDSDRTLPIAKPKPFDISGLKHSKPILADDMKAVVRLRNALINSGVLDRVAKEFQPETELSSMMKEAEKFSKSEVEQNQTKYDPRVAKILKEIDKTHIDEDNPNIDYSDNYDVIDENGNDNEDEDYREIDINLNY